MHERCTTYVSSSCAAGRVPGGRHAEMRDTTAHHNKETQLEMEDDQQQSSGEKRKEKDRAEQY